MKVISDKNKLYEAKAKNLSDPEAAADAIDADGAEQVVDVPNEPSKKDMGTIWKCLDDSLTTAKRKMLVANKIGKDEKGNFIEPPSDFPNVLFIGGAGIGKTSQIYQWAKERGVNLFMLQGSSLDAADMGGLPMVSTTEIDPETGKEKKVTKLRAQKVGTGILDQLDRPNSVLFLDELNRARPDVRAALLQLICDHIVQDFQYEGGRRFFPNFLFTVAAINPADQGDSYQTYQLDQAEKGRFRNKAVKAENAVWMDHAENKYKKEAEILKDDDPVGATEDLGRAALAKAIAGNSGFLFDDDEDLLDLENDKSWNGLATTPRNLTLLLDNCRGTKDSLLDMWSDYCNNKHEPLIKRILSNYKDVDNKANSVFQDGTQSSLLNKKKNGLDAIRNKYASSGN